MLGFILSAQLRHRLQIMRTYLKDGNYSNIQELNAMNVNLINRYEMKRTCHDGA